MCPAGRAMSPAGLATCPAGLAMRPAGLATGRAAGRMAGLMAGLAPPIRPLLESNSESSSSRSGAGEESVASEMSEDRAVGSTVDCSAAEGGLMVNPSTMTATARLLSNITLLIFSSPLLFGPRGIRI